MQINWNVIIILASLIGLNSILGIGKVNKIIPAMLLISIITEDEIMQCSKCGKEFCLSLNRILTLSAQYFESLLQHAKD
jgi:hypothetical protein